MIEVADQSSDALPLAGVRVPQPETPENCEEIVNLNITDRCQCWSELFELRHLLHVLVAVEDEHLPGVTHQLALRPVTGEAGAVAATQREAAPCKHI